MDQLKKHSWPDEFRFELSDFVRNAWKHRWAIIAMTVALTTSVAIGAMRLPKVYQATAKLLIDPALPRVLGENTAVENLAEQARQERAFYSTQLKVISSRMVLKDVVERLSLGQDPEFLEATELAKDANARSFELALSSMLEVEEESHSRIVNIFVKSRFPELSSRLANTVGQAYIDHTLERRMETTRTAARWLDEQVEEFAGRLETLEESLNGFQQENLLVSVSLEDRQNMISANLSMLNERVIETRSSLIALRAQRDTISDFAHQFGSNPELPPPLLKSDVVTTLRTQLTDLRKSKAEASSRYGDRHPVMKALSQQIAETKETLSREIDTMLSNLEAEILALEETQFQFEEEIRKEKERALALNGLGLQYRKLNREFGTTKDTYESLLKRRTETSLSGLLESNYVHWFEKSEPPRGPVSPSIPLYALLGLAVGLGVSLSFIALATVLDNTIRSRSELEELLGVPVLGTLPAVIGPSKGDTDSAIKRDLYIHDNPSSTAAESFRSVRTNILLLTADNPPKALLVTSPRPQEGKTTTALALAISMAQANNRVLLVDTDLRRPRLHKALSVSNRSGITSALVDGDVDAAVKATQIGSLDLLPCGPLPPNPTELLHSERLARLIAELRERYDRIIFDSPPVNFVADASILSTLVDGSILVIRANNTPREAARFAMRQLRDVGGRLYGVVLNSTEDSSKYYNHYYHYRSDGLDPVLPKSPP
ncbi:MAG: GumC family protein [Myxococcota bacterium]